MHHGNEHKAADKETYATQNNHSDNGFHAYSLSKIFFNSM
jgi:hypothetical protein